MARRLTIGDATHVGMLLQFYIIVLGSKWVIPNIFVPLNYESLTSMMWWSLWTYASFPYLSGFS